LHPVDVFLGAGGGAGSCFGCPPDRFQNTGFACGWRWWYGLGGYGRALPAACAKYGLGPHSDRVGLAIRQSRDDDVRCFNLQRLYNGSATVGDLDVIAIQQGNASVALRNAPARCRTCVATLRSEERRGG